MAYHSNSWSKGKARFGARMPPDLTIHTQWTTNDIQMRKEFEMTAKLRKNPVLYIFYDESAKVYINDIQIDNKQFNRFQTTYSAHDIDPKLFKEGKM